MEPGEGLAAAALVGDRRSEGQDRLDPSIGVPALLERLGGIRGVVDGALPPTVFLLVTAVDRFAGPAPATPTWASAASFATGLVLLVWRLVRREPVKPALRGLVGLVLAVGFAWWSGEARNYFLPGIGVDGAYAIGFAASAAAGHPLVGVIYGSLHRMAGAWRRQPGLRRALTVATWGWTGVFAVRAAGQALFYLTDQPELLGLTKLLLGWPVTVPAVILTLRAAQRARTGHCPGGGAEGR